MHRPNGHSRLPFHRRFTIIGEFNTILIGDTKTENFVIPVFLSAMKKKRNSRNVHSYDPTAIFNWDWKIDDESKLSAGVGFHYSQYSNSAIAFYNAPDPRPD